MESDAFMKNFVYILLASFAFSSCQVSISTSGGQFSGASSFSVGFFKSQSALASPLYSQRITESLKDLLLSQSPLKWQEENGDLQYDGSVTNYFIAPATVQGGEAEIASMNRLSISVKVKYTNTLEPALSFEKTFTRFADFKADADIIAVEEDLWSEINDQLIQDIYNASVGNW